MDELSVTCNQIQNKDVEHKKFQGQKYLVAPVIIVQEQVLNGELLTSNELSKYVVAWNGAPITVPHPKDNQGRKVSANSSPKILEKHQIGKVFNVFYDKQKKQLKGEVWINEDKVNKVPNGEKSVKRIKNNKPLDVSSGYFADTTNETGYHNGQRYNGKQYNLRPDHLALLPNSQGACSWKDGCGIRSNEEGGIINPKEQFKGLFDRFLDSLGSIDSEIVDNELSDRDVRSQLRKKLTSKFGGNNIRVSIKEVFPDHVIFRVIDTRVNRETTLYQVSYSREDEEVSLGDDAQEVQRRVEYEPVNNKEDEDMKINEDAGRKEIISNVLDCDCNKMSEDTLKAMNDEELEFYAQGLECNEEEPETNEEENKESGDVETNDLQKVVSKALEPISNKLEELENEVKQNKMKEKEPYIEALKANDDNPFSEKELKAMELEKLKKLSDKFIDNVVDYSGLGGPRVNANGEEEEYESPTINDFKSDQGGNE